VSSSFSTIRNVYCKVMLLQCMQSPSLAAETRSCTSSCNASRLRSNYWSEHEMIEFLLYGGSIEARRNFILQITTCQYCCLDHMFTRDQ
jgi:hypothetical protein